MKKKVIYLTVVFLLLFSCTNSKTPEYSFEDVPIIIDMEAVKKDTLKIKYIKFIPLETTDDCLIGGYCKTMIKNNRIYLCDCSHANALFVFDMNGKYLFKIARMGQGPGEYIRIMDFDIDKNGDIYLFDAGYGKRILVFDSTGKYIRTIQLEYNLGNFCLIDEKMYLSKPFDSRRRFACLVTYDMNNKKTEIILDNKYLFELDDSNPFDFYHSPDSIIFYAPTFSKIIFSIDNEGIHPVIGVKNLKETPKSTIEEWLREDNYMERMKLRMQNKYFTDLSYIFENENYISFTFINDRNFLFYNKHTKVTFQIPFSSLWDSLGSSLIQGSTGESFFSVFTFDIEYKTHKKILESREELKNWHEEDNPVIVLFDLDN